jgi:glycosyltransferase involved in cell wall biosynthesis
MSPTRLLLALTYYRPHVSGLSISAQRLARGLARHGHQVTVLTSRFHPSLPAREHADGVDILRVPVRFKLGKGLIMPLFPAYAAVQLRRHDVVNIHMPQLEAVVLALLGRAYGRAVVVSYHCDLHLPGGSFNRLVERGLQPLNHLAAQLAHRIVVTTDDYARHSPFLRRYAHKLVAIPPLIEMPPAEAETTQRLAARWRFNGRPQIGFAGRFAADKGVEHLLRALPYVLEQVPDARLVFTGAHQNTVGEEKYLALLSPLLRQHADRLIFTDLLRDDEMPSFFSLCDVLAVTSLNATEAFGMVQVESMLAGTPVVSTDLPGVREPVRRTGMGEIVAPRNPEALAAALVRVIQRRAEYLRPREQVVRAFDPEEAVAQHEALFAGLIDRTGKHEWRVRR